jgi:hypothetical protein
MLATPKIGDLIFLWSCQVADEIFEYKYSLDAQRYAAHRASDTQRTEKDRERAGKIAESYEGVLLKLGVALLDRLDFCNATMH